VAAAAATEASGSSANRPAGGAGSDAANVAAAAATQASGSSANRPAGGAGSDAANVAAVKPPGTLDGSSASPGRSAGETAGAQSAPPPELASGLVEAPGKQATRREEVIAQTLDGMLPLTLGIDGQGEFDFDKAILRLQVSEQLDVLAARLKEAQYDRLEIVGHTDRIGTEDYNQYLSERRAWAVARYLVDQGVPASKIRVEGRGMHEPLTPLQECNGQLSREQLIACLQLDRRVVISASIRKVDVKVQ